MGTEQKIAVGLARALRTREIVMNLQNHLWVKIVLEKLEKLYI